METNQISGKVWLFGDNIDTDLIYPVECLFSMPGGITDREEIKKHAMAGLDPGFVAKIQLGDMVVAGTNFGCGSHREQAVTSLKYAGISLIIAKSFARNYYRNAINIGLPVAEWAADEFPHLVDGDTLQVDLRTGIARNAARGTQFALKPMPPLLLDILLAGGLAAYIRTRGTNARWKSD